MAFFLTLAAAFATTDWLVRHRARFNRGPYRLLLLIPAALVFVAILFAPRGYVLGKVAGQLLMPVGLLWLALLACAAYAFHRARPRLLALFGALFVAFTAAGNPYLGDLLLEGLEAPYTHVRPLRARPFDAVLVLGGGTASDSRGRYYLASSGDRVALAARLYHAGKTPLLMTSGVTLPEMALQEDSAVITRTLWRELGVPDEAIVTVPGAHNTREEAAAYARVIRERRLRRVGLVTSAWHLRRALARFRGEGLRVVALPADRRGIPHWEGFWSLVPSGGGFEDVQTAAWEYLGAAVGR